MDIDKIIEAKYSEHQLELYNLEKNLEEYKEKIWHNGKIVKRDINSEKQIKIEESYYKFVKSLKLLGFEHWGYSEPPAMKPIMPGATTDWDFSSTSWNLDTTIYVSPPSSLRSYGAIAECKYTGTTNLPQGRIKTYIMFDSSGSPSNFNFRNQVPVGSVNTNNTYHIIFSRNSLWYSRYVGGSSTTLVVYSGLPLLDYGVWLQMQLTWWNDVGGAGLMIRFECPIGTKRNPDVNDPVNQWATSSINRCGFIGASGYPCHFDDTEIWGP
jgi:hypothetical protein